jgi:2-dehydro-3-deoxyglucarate aldolase
MKNELKEKLRKGEVAIGCWVTTPSLDVTKILAYVGFDWLVFDMEHAPLTMQDVQKLIAVVDPDHITPMVRVASNDPVLIKLALDVGAYGLLIPHVDSREEAIKAVKACKYPPKGIRGVGPRYPSMYGAEFKEYVSTADDEILMLVMIEHIDAVNRIDEIVSVPDLDGFLIGPGDLSASMGLLNEACSYPPNVKVQESMAKVREAGKRHGVIAGVWAGSVDSAKEYVAQGYSFVALAQDTDYIHRARQDLDRIATTATSHL